MKTDRFYRDLYGSLRAPFTIERRLSAGTFLGLVVHLLWVVLSGAVLVSVPARLEWSFAFDPWTSGTTLYLITLGLVWIVGPALAGTYLLTGELLRKDGSLAHHYRVQYPLTLVVVPLGLSGLLVAVGLVLGDFPLLLLVLLAGISVFGLARTLAFSYRVFALSVPRFVQAFILESLALIAATVVVEVAVWTGRKEAVLTVTQRIDGALGTPTVTPLVAGPVEIASVSAPGLPALAAGFPVVLAVVYVLGQTATGLVVRLRSRTVPRAQIRTGQRYPAFARPSAGPTDRRRTALGKQGSHHENRSADQNSPHQEDRKAADGVGPDTVDSRTGSDTVERADPSAETERLDGVDPPNQTRVFVPPDDTSLDEALEDAGHDSTTERSDTSDSERDGVDSKAESELDNGDEDSDSETENRPDDGGDSDDNYECSACGSTFSGRTNFAFCPTCGTELGSE